MPDALDDLIAQVGDEGLRAAITAGVEMLRSGSAPAVSPEAVGEHLLLPTATVAGPGAGPTSPTHRVISGENLHALAALRDDLAEGVDLVYLDPPFPRKWSCCGVVCGHVEPDPSDVEAGPFAA